MSGIVHFPYFWCILGGLGGLDMEGVRERSGLDLLTWGIIRD